MTLSPPEPLSESHRLEQFDCGHEGLNRWLKTHGLKNQASGASRTYVVCEGQVVRAFYTLAASAVATAAARSRLRRNMPDPIPVAVLGRLAVDRRFQGHGIGRALVRDAVLRVIQAAGAIGIRGLIVHALDDTAKGFYERLGFDVSPLDPMLLMATLADLEDALR
ncbi:MAG: GNAT family N-acetyltransferase [Dissulfuribacterales bacterium]